MKPRLFVFLFVVALLLVLGAIAAACGDNGDESDEDAIRDTLQMFATACNERDSDRHTELSTANFVANFGCPSGGFQDLEILSVTVDGDQASAVTTRTIGDSTSRETLGLVKEDDRWLLNDVIASTIEFE